MPVPVADTDIPFGNIAPDIDPDRLRADKARQLLQACLAHSAFEVCALGQVRIGDSGDIGDLIVVECCDGTVPSRNLVGIKNRERLALVYCENQEVPYSVRALRKGFPVTLHQNHVASGDPASLCLYFEPWTAVEREWTEQKFLQRILWWLRETANDRLHRLDQPLEQLYFEPSFEIVLPPGLAQNTTELSDTISFVRVSGPCNKRLIVRAMSGQVGTAGQLPFAEWLSITPDPVRHGTIEPHPNNLQELDRQFRERGSGLLSLLKDAVKAKITPKGVDRSSGAFTLLLVHSTIESDSDDRRKKKLYGFQVKGGIAEIAISLGLVIEGEDKMLYLDHQIGSVTTNELSCDADETAGRDIDIFPVAISQAITKEDARLASGVPGDSGNFKGVLAGLGALGSVLANLWGRSGWGCWTFVDNDTIATHNLVRHNATDIDVGRSKAEVVSEHTSSIYYPGQNDPVAIHSKLLDPDTPELEAALSDAQLVVDATTTLAMPRDYSVAGHYPRACSAFLTPSGLSSVLLAEDDKRSLPLHALEAQYYRALINEPWAKDHLKGHAGHVWVGAGCRDASLIISAELIQLHGSNLARQIRKHCMRSAAQICVWNLDDDTGSVSAVSLPTAPIRTEKQGEWRIIWDDAIIQKLNEMRSSALPAETGGIIVGYFDQKLKHTYVVDVQAAPADSDRSPTSFVRGVAGLVAFRDACRDRTAYIVDYIGEWHSHPAGASSTPSNLDEALIGHLAETMGRDGLPALMAIVSERGIGFTLKEMA